MPGAEAHVADATVVVIVGYGIASRVGIDADIVGDEGSIALVYGSATV